MEGNIVFRQGQRMIYADRMYYDVPNHVGTILNADMLTPVPSYEGLLRLHADVVQQTAQDRFCRRKRLPHLQPHGRAGLSASVGRHLPSKTFKQPLFDPATGQPLVDPCTGQPLVEHHRLATADNDFVYVGRCRCSIGPRSPRT